MGDDLTVPTEEELALMPEEKRTCKMMALNLQVMSALMQKSAQTERRLDKIENDTPIRAYQDHLLENARRKRVVKLMGGKTSAAYLNRQLARKVFRAIMVDYRTRFGVEAYQDTPQSQFKRALRFYDQWEPDFELYSTIKQLNGDERNE